MYSISDLTKENLERSLGINLVAFNAMTADEQRIWIKRIKDINIQRKVNRKKELGKKKRKREL